MSEEAFEVKCRTWKSLNGETKEIETPSRNRNSELFHLLLVSLCKFPPLCENNRSFNEISRDRKAAERRRSSKVTSRESYFGASEATIASNRGSRRSGSQSGSRRRWP